MMPGNFGGYGALVTFVILRIIMVIGSSQPISSAQSQGWCALLTLMRHLAVMDRIVSSLAARADRVLPAVATGLLYFAAALSALNWSHGQDGIATVWPSSGILLAALLLSPWERAGWHIGAASIASLAANLLQGNSLWTASGFTVANMLESFIAARLLLRRSSGWISFSDPARLLEFCTAASLAAVSAATIATAFAPTPSLMFWFSWLSTDLLGILLVTPLILVVAAATMKQRIRSRTRTRTEVFGIFAMLVLICVLTFAQSTYPLLFLPMLAILVAVSRIGLLGAAGGVVIAAVVSSVAISYGSGPVMLVDANPQFKSLFVQFYLLALFAAALPMSALLAARRRLLGQLSESVRLLQLAETAAQVGHWRLDIGSGAVTWSPEVFKIHGVKAETPRSLALAVDAYHPEDRNLVTEKLDHAIQHQCAFEFTARIIRPSGEIRHVLSRGEFEKGMLHGTAGMFGIIQDITSQVIYEKDLLAASALARQAANDAKQMAETDQLTGIANRRRISAELEMEIAKSTTHGRPLAIAIFDIDHFKQINDRFGHHVGDEVLKRVAIDAERELRSDDMLGRFGGEEFVILFPGAGSNIALMVAERVRRTIEAGGANPSVTVSIGVAEFAQGETGETILRRADEALYAAKADGRNLLRLAS